MFVFLKQYKIKRNILQTANPDYISQFEVGNIMEIRWSKDHFKILISLPSVTVIITVIHYIHTSSNIFISLTL